MPSGQTMYYHHGQTFDKETIIFYCAGHKNDLNSHKGVCIEQICERNQIPFIHWAYYGWSGSTGTDVPINSEGFIKHWFQQSYDFFDTMAARFPDKKFILIGYSMGAVLALTLALNKQKRLKGYIGIATGFGPELIDMALELYDDYNITFPKGDNRQIKDLQFKKRDDHHLIPTAPLDLDIPIYFQHAKDDHLVPHENTSYFFDAMNNKELGHIQLFDHGAHRLYDDEHLSWLEQTLLNLV